jgi:hypothetical protein
MIRRWRAAERRPYRYHLEVGNLAGLQLKLELVSDQGNKFGIRKFLPKKNVGATCGRPLAGIGIWGWRAANGRPYGENLEIRRFRKLLLKTRAMYSKFGSFPERECRGGYQPPVFCVYDPTLADGGSPPLQIFLRS